jgi:chemotaxis signal transduction protein
MNDAHSTTAAGGGRLAEVVIGAVRIGIAADAVVLAIPAPATPALLPRRQGALSGIVNHDGMLVPVVDLARWVDVGTHAAGPGRQLPRILILRTAGTAHGNGARVIGLRVDAVGGLVDVAPDAVMRLHHDDDAEEVFHSAARSADGDTILSLLDIDRLATLAAAWSDVGGDGDAAPAEAPAAAAAAAQTAPYALLRAGATRLAVPAGALAQVIPMPVLEGFGAGQAGAYCMWRGRHLPVLDSDLLAPPDAAPAGLLAVLEHDGLALGVPVHAALQLGAFDPLGVPPDAVAATVYDADGALQLIDTAALFARCPQAALSRRAPARAAGTSDGLNDSRNDSACIVFEADGMGATRIEAVEQVLPLAGAVAATMPWQGQAIAVVDLRAQARDGAGHVLVVRGARGRIACIVTRVHVLIPAGTGRLYRMGMAGGHVVEFITTGDGAERASYRMMDLAA